MKFQLSILISTLLLTGCLETREQLRETESRRTQVSAAQERQAQANLKIDEYDQQLRSFNGRLEVVENHLSQINAGHADRVNQEQRGREDLDRRFRAFEEALGKIEIQLGALGEELKELKAQKSRAEAAPAKDRDSFGAAEDAFTQKDWKLAIVEYENYRRANPKGKSYSTATYKIGAAFLELKKKDEARVFFEEVVAKFPSSKDAKKASQKLKTMK